ncbi:MAG: AlwI family type II restriction endonuclease [Dysgonomonas sp.]
MNKRKSEYKPLLFTTTMRNPMRMKALLNVLKDYNGLILSDELTTEIMGVIISYGLYRPTRGITSSIERKWGAKKISEKSQIGIKVLNEGEIRHLLMSNPQKHKEAGFEKGWPSRFATIFDFAKELGFVYYEVGLPLMFSSIGLRLANSVEINIDNDTIIYSEPHPEFEQQAFRHALAKYQRCNPFVRVLNENVPLVLLLEVIRKINNDNNFNNAGIAIHEIPLILFWKNNDSQGLYQRIKTLREKYRYNPSWEVIIDICINEIMEGKYKDFEPKSIMVDYPDEFIRKMRLTGLISIRGGGRFIDINHNEIEKVNYILENYSNYAKFQTEQEYFNYMSTIDENLISFTAIVTTIEQNNVLLDRWTNIYSWEKIKEELTILHKKGTTKDDILKYLTNPIRLEFLTSMAIKSKFPAVTVIPNYPCDDEGIPTSTAGGGKGDVECIEDEVNGVLVEVTMAEGRNQTIMEVWPISRHLEDFRENYPNAICYFVAPSIFKDSVRQIKFVRNDENLNIKPYTITDFIQHLDNAPKLYING